MRRFSPNTRGLTLIELMVTLILSIMVLSMILPLLHDLAKGQNPVSKIETSLLERPWQLALDADLHELISASKCGIPVFQLLPASDTRPYPELVLQTFCRASGADIASMTRGPSEIRYSLEPDSAAGPLVLVRYARGWHDPAVDRHVLQEHVTGWMLSFEGIAPPLPSDDSIKDATAAAPQVRPGRLEIQISGTTHNQQASFWVPLLNPLPPDPKKQDSADKNSGDIPRMNTPEEP